MEQDVIQQAASPSTRGVTVSPEHATCSSCGTRSATSPASYVYALGRIEPRFPRLGVEKEYAQATGRAQTAGLTDREALYKVLSERQNRYLVKQLCWVLSIEGIEAYFLQPRDPSDYDLLVDALHPAPHLNNIDVVVGIRGPLVPPDFCNGVSAPMAAFSQIYSFDVDSFVKAIPRPPQIAEKDFPKAAEELFLRVVQMGGNTGTSDHHRALNYLALRYPAIYAKAAEEFARDFSLTSVDVRPSVVTNARNVVEIVFSYTSRTTDFTEKYFVRVDVSEEFPFLVTKLSPYFDR